MTKAPLTYAAPANVTHKTSTTDSLAKASASEAYPFDEAESQMDMSDLVQVSGCGKTVWVHALDGSTVGRFSKVFGMDVHTSATAQMDGQSQCLKCTHIKPEQADWLEFCEMMMTHHKTPVDSSLLSFA